VQDGEKPAHGQHTHAPIHPASPRKLISSRSGLFGAVFDEIVARRVDAVAMDADDLPGYAARLYDQHLATAAPRVGSWDWLERDGAGARSDVVVQALRDKRSAVADAQRRGAVRADLPAETLLTMVLALSRTGVWDPPASDPVAHRAAITQCVARLLCPTCGDMWRADVRQGGRGTCRGGRPTLARR